MQVAIYHTSGSRVHEKIVKEVLRLGSKKVRCSSGANVSVIFISDIKMRQINKAYRGKDRTANVLSFPAHDSCSIIHDSQKDLGDIFISLPEAKREAKKYGWTIRYEIARLALHGFLHLLGYDHEKDGEAKVMEEIESKVLGELF